MGRRALQAAAAGSRQRIVNGGGRVDREYGLGRRRTDLLVLWNFPGWVQRAVIEIKLLYGALSQTVADGLAQTWAYADGCGAEEAHLVIFDRTPGKAWHEKIWQRAGVGAGQGHHRVGNASGACSNEVFGDLDRSDKVTNGTDRRTVFSNGKWLLLLAGVAARLEVLEADRFQGDGLSKCS
jgi:hypothetical protein